MTIVAKCVTWLIADMVVGERESFTFGALHDTLLPKLIPGELRVKNTESSIKEVTV